ncbi:uncharacterized protein FOMMEDRAFT_23031, partial [Fomitiporia mediterranea MF3/22]|uniref:uncharacterized protein n=1 Tax=Fomitiporia mediterranea (strain MF3/22) TaxID=694068 RepID=UPI0004409A66
MWIDLSASLVNLLPCGCSRVQTTPSLGSPDSSPLSNSSRRNPCNLGNVLRE